MHTSWKSWKRASLSLIVSSVLLGCPQEDQSPEEATGDSPTDEEIAIGVVELEEQALTRWLGGDPGGFLDLIHEEYTYFDPDIDERMDGKPTVRAYYLDFFEGVEIHDPPPFRLVDSRVQVFGDAAVLTFNLLVGQPGESLEDTGEYQWHTTEIFQRIDGGWKLISTHWSYPATRLRMMEEDGSLDRDPTAFQDREVAIAEGEEVLRIESEWLELWGRGDPDGYFEVIGPEYTYFDPGLDKRMDGPERVRENFEPIRGSVSIARFEYHEPRVQRVGDLAILTFNLRNFGIGEDGTEELSSHWHTTEVFYPFEGEWKLVSTHWSYTSSWLRVLAERGTFSARQ